MKWDSWASKFAEAKHTAFEAAKHCQNRLTPSNLVTSGFDIAESKPKTDRSRVSLNSSKEKYYVEEEKIDASYEDKNEMVDRSLQIHSMTKEKKNFFLEPSVDSDITISSVFQALDNSSFSFINEPKSEDTSVNSLGLESDIVAAKKKPITESICSYNISQQKDLVYSVEQIYTAISAPPDGEDILNFASLDVLKQSVKTLVQTIKELQLQLKESRDQHDAARETALAATEQVQQLKIRWEEHECLALSNRQNDSCHVKMQQNFNNLYSEYQNTLNSKEELQRICADLQQKLSHATNQIQLLSEQCDDSAKRELSLKQLLAEYKENLGEGNEPTRLAILETTSPPQRKMQVSPLNCLLALHIPQSTVNDISSLLTFLENVLSECDAILNQKSHKNLSYIEDIAPFRQHCKNLLDFLTNHHNFQSSVDLLKEFLVLLSKAFSDFKYPDSSVWIETLVRNSFPPSHQHLHGPGLLIFLFICLIPLADSFGELYFTAADEISCPPCCHETKIEPLPDSTVQDSSSTHLNILNSPAAVVVLTELLAVLNAKILNLQRLFKIEDLDVIVPSMISVLETVEERVDSSKEFTGLSTTLRELFSNVAHLAKQNWVIERKIEELTVQKCQLLDKLRNYRTVFQIPPSEEQLSKAGLEGEVFSIVAIEHPNYPNLFLGCIELIPLKGSSSQESKDTDLWTPGLFWWPLNALEQNVYWLQKIQQKFLRRPLTERITELTEALDYRNERLEFLTREHQKLFLEFENYKKKVAEAFKKINVKSQNLCCKAVQYAFDDISHSASTDSAKNDMKDFGSQQSQKQQENRVSELEDLLHDQESQIKELKTVLEFSLQGKKHVETLLDHEKREVQNSLMKWNEEKHRYLTELDRANQKIESLSLNLFRQKANEACETANTIELGAISSSDEDKKLHRIYNEEVSTDYKAYKSDDIVLEKQSHGSEIEENSPKSIQLTPSTMAPQTKCLTTVESPFSSVPFGTPGAYLSHLRRLLQVREHQLLEEQAEKASLEEQLVRLKQEFRQCTTLLGMQPFVVSTTIEEQHVPIAFVRQTIFRFIVTGCQGSCDHESLIPVIASLFGFTHEEVKQIYEARSRNASFTRWLPALS